VIAAYLHDLERALSFDRSLARRVCEEAEFHLLEAITADPAADKSEAERNAIARFGNPATVAAHFAGISLVRQSRGIAGTAVLIIFGIFVAMKTRIEWYAVAQWTMPTDRKPISDVVLSVDRYAFWISVFVGIAAYLYVTRQKVLTALTGSSQGVRRFYTVCVVATGALSVSVVSDGILTALQLHGTQLCPASIPPLLSLFFEIAAVSFLGLRVLFLMQRAQSTARLLAP
jgi:hypothetical protein